MPCEQWHPLSRAVRGDSTMNIEGSTVINRPFDAVFAFVTDIANFPRWTKEVQTDESRTILFAAC